MGLKFEETAALVTGGNRGLGRSIAEELLRRGAKVYVATRSTDGVDIPGATIVKLDVTDPQQVAELPSAVTDVSMLVNNAGVYVHAEATSPESVGAVRRAVEVNALGLLSVTSALSEVIVRNSGQVVNILSAACWTSDAANLAYGASKSAALSISNTFRAVLGPSGVQVTSVHPDFIDTDMTSTIDIEKISAHDVATAILDGVADGEQEVLIGDLPRAAKAAAARPVLDFDTAGR